MNRWPLLIVALLVGAATALAQESETTLTWNELPSLPDELGVAGPFVGVQKNVLLVAGGANFPRPVWENTKVWHDSIHLLVREGEGDAKTYTWKDGGKLDQPMAYGASVSTQHGIVCIGGNDATSTFASVFLLSINETTHHVTRMEYPDLPTPCAHGAAALIGNTIYVAGGQFGSKLDTAMANFWSLDLSKREDPAAFQWTQHKNIPWSSRAFNLTVRQHNGHHDSLYVISGRRHAASDAAEVNEDAPAKMELLKDVWQYTPNTDTWQRRSDAPQCVMAGTGIGVGQSHVFVLGGADGSLMHRADELQDKHPGFPKQAFSYHTITDKWISAGAIPRNHVTTTAVNWDDAIIIPSGEVRPRVRSPKVWRVKVEPPRGKR